MVRSFGDTLKILRKRYWTQEEFAEIMGTDPTTISNWKRGRYEPGIATLFKLADLFVVTMDQLLGRAPLPEEEAPQMDKIGEAFMYEVQEVYCFRRSKKVMRPPATGNWTAAGGKSNRQQREI